MPSQFAPAAEAGADDTVGAAVSACLALGQAIFEAARRLEPGNLAARLNLGRLGAAVELAALNCRDRGSGPLRAAVQSDPHADAGRLH